MGFLDFLVWMLWIYLVVVCIWIFIWIFIDIFRDHSLNGWAKALWVIFLVILPFLGAIIYLIARGGSMAKRQAAIAQAQAASQADYIRSVAGSASSPAGEISQAQALLDAGTITQAEFDSLKAKALA
ncbi:SHOCT domain-containing protein [Microbacterium candidum]|uniref:SHOCT domain-containing protein n=1 Tax=Microbacterium candidum TaxID=3041922 RepID=A0ABT7MX02_9MICO|nr:SHOCT domain-containing protein [Microbacterium sp. ASV49]MDL9978978.1 SHOCT domain-containing protein [Microbacterium sp. ASV49]